jgi:hypothetical protein
MRRVGRLCSAEFWIAQQFAFITLQLLQLRQKGTQHAVLDLLLCLTLLQGGNAAGSE